jgi:hypothetical protein
MSGQILMCFYTAMLYWLVKTTGHGGEHVTTSYHREHPILW